MPWLDLLIGATNRSDYRNSSKWMGVHSGSVCRTGRFGLYC